MASATFTIEGDVNIAVTITEIEDGQLQFDLLVLDETGSIGDLNALYFDLYDDSLTNLVTVDGADVTGTAFKINGVTKVDNYTNMNGSELKSLDDKFDVGVQFGTQGIGTDDIRETSFTLSAEGTALSLANFSLQDFGVRLTSVGEEGGSRDDSLKIVDTAPELVVDPPVIDADDKVCVTEDKSFNTETDADSFILIANDPGATSITSVTTSAGETFDISATDTIITNPDGTQLLVSPDGSFSVSVKSPFNDPYGYLNAGETESSFFSYTTDNGITATVEVCIDGVDDILPPPPPPPGGGGF